MDMNTDLEEYLSQLLSPTTSEFVRDLRLKDLARVEWYVREVMRILSGNESTTIPELSRNLELSQTTLTVIVDRLVSDALCYRKHDSSNTSKVCIVLSEYGKSICENSPKTTLQ